MGNSFFMTDQNLHETDKQLFNRIAQDYIKKDCVAYCRIARQLRLSRTLRIENRSIDNMLEIGCGAGFTIAYLDKHKINHYLGVDYSKNLIDYALTFNKPDYANYICTDIHDFHCENKYSVILMIGVLHHLDNIGSLLVKLRKCLVDDGIIVANEPQAGNPIIGLLRKIRKGIDSSYSSSQVELSKKELHAHFSDAGYEVKSYPQGVISTPFAESTIFPSFIGLPIAKASAVLDPWLEDHLLCMPCMDRLSWNIVIVAKKLMK